MNYTFLRRIIHSGLVVLFVVIGQTLLAQADNKTDANGLKQGYWVKKQSNGKVKYRGQFKDDIPYGKFKYYSTKGELASVLEYQTTDSVLATHFHPNGKKSAYGFYVNQKKEGVWRFYDRKGIISSKTTFVNGLKNGEMVVYNLNGSISRETTFTDDVENGYRKTFDSDGNLLTEGAIKDGQMDGLQIIYRNGKINVKGAYKHAVRQGDWEYYDEEGKLYNKEHYELGVKTN
jgi:antitoxin component YwqK of YwqJK toxin-antitoxin module